MLARSQGANTNNVGVRVCKYMFGNKTSKTMEQRRCQTSLQSSQAVNLMMGTYCSQGLPSPIPLVVAFIAYLQG